MKKILLFLLLATNCIQAQVINFPDANFKAKLLSASATNGVAYTTATGGTSVKIDTNNNGEIEVAEAAIIKRLAMYDAAIADLSGIEFFTQLRNLYCRQNDIVTVNLSALTNLIDLDLNYNNIISLSGSNLPGSLLYLHVENNPMTSFDPTGLNNIQTLSVSGGDIMSLNTSVLPSSLTSLDCSANNLSTLDISGMNALLNLSCSSNHITSLNLAGATSLQSLRCAGNNLTSLNLTGMHNLDELNFRVNSISSVDLSDVENLRYFIGDFNQLQIVDLNKFQNLQTASVTNNPQLTTLLIKNGSVEPTVNVFNSPNLVYVCGDEAQMSALQTVLSAHPDCVLSSYCSFTPGGDYNSILGNVRFDVDANGCSAADSPADFLRIDISGNSTGAEFVNNTGDYKFDVGTGNFTVTPHFENPAYFTTSPGSATANFPTLDNLVVTQDFCIAPNGVNPDLEIVLAPMWTARPGAKAWYKIVYRNKGNQILSGSFSMGFDGNLMDVDYTAPDAAVVAPNLLTWNFTDLKPFQSGVANVVFEVNTPLDTPPVDLGTQLVYTATISIPANEVTPADNAFTLTDTVINSYDPNDKICLEGATVTPEKIGQYLHYNINFENIGTAEAINVVVKDVIDVTKFDIGSLQIVQASHPVRVKLTGNVVEFFFAGINLPSAISNPIGGHGNVLFKIKTLPNLQTGDVVTNTANIYFDYNHPIVTNEARTTFSTLKIQEFPADESVVIYPNPASDKVQISAADTIRSVSLYDLQGRVLQVSTENQNAVTLDISTREPGVYFAKIATGKGVKIVKLVKK